jgi:hypothetical protein
MTALAAAAPAIVAKPLVPAFAPVTAMIVAHVVPVAIIVEQIDAIAGIPIAVIPAPAIADIVEAIAIVTVVIAIERAVRIAIIRAIAAVIHAHAHVVIAARKPQCSCRQCRDAESELFAGFLHISPLMWPGRSDAPFVESQARPIVTPNCRFPVELHVNELVALR